jgi:hypothetical protein
MSGRRLADGIVLATCIGAFVGCGAGDDGPTFDAADTEAPVRISLTDFKGKPPGSPQYAALQWWQAVQLNKPELAQRLYARRPSLPDLAGQFNVVGEALAGLPTIERVQREEGQTVLVVNWTKREQRPPSKEVRLRMVEVDDEWKLADNRLLDVLLQEREEREAQPAR